jgi:predicted outer membrane protein
MRLRDCGILGVAAAAGVGLAAQAQRSTSMPNPSPAPRPPAQAQPQAQPSASAPNRTPSQQPNANLDAGRLAEKNGQSPEIQNFGKKLVADHTRSQNEVGRRRRRPASLPARARSARTIAR